jgi:hypothetical protein
MANRAGRQAFLYVILLSSSIAGCTNVEGLRPDISAKPVPSRLDEIAYINELRSVFRADSNSLCFDGNGLKPFVAKSAEGLDRSDSSEDLFPDETKGQKNGQCIRYKNIAAGEAGKLEVRKYLAAGFGLTDLYCQRFFTVSAASEQNRKFSRNFSSGVDAMINTILSVTGAGEVPLGIANAGFEALDNTFESYDSAFLVAPDMANVRKLVFAAQDEFKKSALDTKRSDFPTEYQSARSIVERYAGHCSFTGMRDLINQSIKDKTDEINTQTANADAPLPQPKKPNQAPEAVETNQKRVLTTPVPPS